MKITRATAVRLATIGGAVSRGGAASQYGYAASSSDIDIVHGKDPNIVQDHSSESTAILPTLTTTTTVHLPRPLSGSWGTRAKRNPNKKRQALPATTTFPLTYAERAAEWNRLASSNEWPAGVGPYMAAPGVPPADCKKDSSGVVFDIGAVQDTAQDRFSAGLGKTLRTSSLKKMEGAGPWTVALINGTLMDQSGGIGGIVANHQFQHDKPSQAGTIYNSGFCVLATNLYSHDVEISGFKLFLGDSAQFWACEDDNPGYKWYFSKIEPSCAPIAFFMIPTTSSDPTAAGPPHTLTMTTSSVPLSSAPSSGVNESEQSSPKPTARPTSATSASAGLSSAPGSASVIEMICATQKDERFVLDLASKSREHAPPKTDVGRDEKPDALDGVFTLKGSALRNSQGHLATFNGPHHRLQFVSGEPSFNRSVEWSICDHRLQYGFIHRGFYQCLMGGRSDIYDSRQGLKCKLVDIIVEDRASVTSSSPTAPAGSVGPTGYSTSLPSAGNVTSNHHMIKRQETSTQVAQAGGDPGILEHFPTRRIDILTTGTASIAAQTITDYDDNDQPVVYTIGPAVVVYTDVPILPAGQAAASPAPAVSKRAEMDNSDSSVANAIQAITEPGCASDNAACILSHAEATFSIRSPVTHSTSTTALAAREEGHSTLTKYTTVTPELPVVTVLVTDDSTSTTASATEYAALTTSTSTTTSASSDLGTFAPDVPPIRIIHIVPTTTITTLPITSKPGASYTTRTLALAPGLSELCEMGQSISCQPLYDPATLGNNSMTHMLSFNATGSPIFPPTVHSTKAVGAPTSGPIHSGGPTSSPRPSETAESGAADGSWKDAILGGDGAWMALAIAVVVGVLLGD